MSKVDILRFVDNLHELFAPAILDGQTFFAYLDEQDNFFSIQCDNLFSGDHQEDIERISASVTRLATQLDDVQDDCSDIPSIKSQIQSLQSDVEALQSSTGEASSGGSSSGSSIIAVDDIIWGVFDASNEYSSLPANLKAMRGRQYLNVNDTNYSLPTFLVVNFFSSGQLLTNSLIDEVTSTKVLAAFYDSKIYTVNAEGIISSVNLNDSDTFINKADNSLYVYDARNHKFIKTGGKRHYIVDMFIDYIGTKWPSNIPDGGMLILKPESQVDYDYFVWEGHYEYINSRYYATFSLDNGTSFANISSELTDDACIYIYEEGYDNSKIRVIHELYDGDSIYNKVDGCTYIFSANGNDKSFVRVSEPVIPPVCDILHIGNNMPDSPSAAGDKYLDYEPNDTNFSGWLFTAVSDSDWGYGTQIDNIDDFYASLDNHKIYSFGGWSAKPFMPITIPTGVPFLNKADNSLYVWDGSQFIKTS